MKLDQNLRFPLIVISFTLVVCVVLIILPVEQIVTTYVVVNGVKTVEFVPKWEGIIKMLISHGVCATAWILIRRWIKKIIANHKELVSYRVIGFAVSFLFFAWASLPAAMGILSIILTFT